MAQLGNSRNRIREVDGLSFGNQAPTSSGGSIGGGGGTGGTPDPPVAYTPEVHDVTVVNNSTGALALGFTSLYAGLHLSCYWKRNTTYGVCTCHAFHDGSTVTFSPKDGVNPGWNPGSFTGSLAGGTLTLTFAADNSGSNIEMKVLVEALPEI